MGNVNYGRLIAGAVIAAVFYFICDGFIHGALLGRYHMAAWAHAGYPTVLSAAAVIVPLSLLFLLPLARQQDKEQRRHQSRQPPTHPLISEI